MVWSTIKSASKIPIRVRKNSAILLRIRIRFIFGESLPLAQRLSVFHFLLNTPIAVSLLWVLTQFRRSFLLCHDWA